MSAPKPIPRVGCAALLIGSLAAATSAESPNIVLLLADDLGWTGTSVQMDSRVPESRSDLYRTPHLERLASEGMRFSNAYSPAPNCSPTRMSIQTGKTAVRLGATDIIDVVPDESGQAVYHFFYEAFYLNKPLHVPLPISDLAESEITIAELLKDANERYRAAHIGKWHMGGGTPASHGFDVHDGLTGNAPGRQGPPDPKRTGEITRKALGFLDDTVASGRPFFLQVSYYAVHNPVRARVETVERYNTYDSRVHTNTGYAAMTDELDESVGLILDRLDSLGLGETTYVIFTSDNGGEVDIPTTNNVPLAKGKTHVWEGGIRVPLLVRGPGIPAGQESHEPAIGYDLLPTIADWVGATSDLPHGIDGGSLRPVLEGTTSPRVRRGTSDLIWYYGAYRNMKHVTPHAAIRRGSYKLIRLLESGRELLYDLDLDLAETTDLSSYYPERTRELSTALTAYFTLVDVALPTPNPDYDPNLDTGLLRVRADEARRN